MPTVAPLFSPVAPQSVSHRTRFGILDTHEPASCRLQRFSVHLSGALSAQGADVRVVGAAPQRPRPADGQAIAAQVNGDVLSSAACSYMLNQADVALVQHDFDSCDDSDGDRLIDVVAGLSVPSIVIAHTVPKHPTAQQRSVLEAISSVAGQVVVMSEAARSHLYGSYTVDRRKLTLIPHGATVPTTARMKRPSRPTILTWGWLAPGNGVERVIEVMASLNDVPGRPRYLIAGPTHPKALAADGEAYREARTEQARSRGVADSVSFDPGYYDGSMLNTLFQQCSVVVLPYDSTEQATSGVLVEAIANGRPVVATAFPHAVELLNGGAGIVVDHDDPAALASALRRVVTQPRLAGSMAAEARQLAPQLDWSVVAGAYLQLAQRLLPAQQVRA